MEKIDLGQLIAAALEALEEDQKHQTRACRKNSSEKSYTFVDLFRVLKPGMIVETTIDGQHHELMMGENGVLVSPDNPEYEIPIDYRFVRAMYRLKEKKRYPVSYHTAFESYRTGSVIEVKMPNEERVVRLDPNNKSSNVYMTMDLILNGEWYVVEDEE